MKVGTEKIDLTSVVPVSDTLEGEDLEACVSLLKINERGGSINDEIYTWSNWGGTDVGWNLDGDFIKPGDLELDPGTALWTDVNPEVTDLSFQCAGQVAEKDVVLPVVKGFSIGGNPFPVAYDMINAYPTSDTYSGEDLEACVSLLKINERGGSINDEVYTWSNWGGTDVGWNLDGDFIAEGDLVLQPGEALWMDNGNVEDLVLNFPCMIELK